MADGDDGEIEDIALDANTILTIREHARQYANCRDERGILSGNVMLLVNMMLNCNGKRLKIVNIH